MKVTMAALAVEVMTTEEEEEDGIPVVAATRILVVEKRHQVEHLVAQKLAVVQLEKVAVGEVMKGDRQWKKATGSKSAMGCNTYWAEFVVVE